MSDLTEYSFEPINNAHAIVEVVFFCEFQEKLSDSIIKEIIGLKNDNFFSEEFPKISPMNEVEMSFSFGETSESQKHNSKQIGLEMLKNKCDENNSIEWMTRITNSSISIHCLDYTCWNEVWGKVKEIFSKVFSKTTIDYNHIDAIGLQYIDRFKFNGDPSTKYNYLDLFKNPSEFSHPKSMSSGPMWHCHTGWFEDILDSTYKCLNQLNIDSGYSQGSDIRKHFTTIVHNLVVRAEDKKPDFKLDDLNLIMEELHSKNKKMLLELLDKKMAIRLSL